jgi:hypothetical protein
MVQHIGKSRRSEALAERNAKSKLYGTAGYTELKLEPASRRKGLDSLPIRQWH